MNSTPDYGEPWQLISDDEIWSDNEDEGTLAIANGCIRDRIIACVNACAGMADPEKEIVMLKQAGVANAQLHLEAVDAAAEIAAMREAIRFAYKGLLTADDDGDYSDHGPNDVTKALAKLQPFIQ